MFRKKYFWLTAILIALVFGYFFSPEEPVKINLDEVAFPRLFKLLAAFPFLMLLYISVIGPTIEEFAFRSWTIQHSKFTYISYAFTTAFLAATHPILILPWGIIVFLVEKVQSIKSHKAIVLLCSTSILFAVVHFERLNAINSYVIFYLIIGVLLGIISLKLNLTYAIFTHILWNTMVSYFYFSGDAYLSGNEEKVSSGIHIQRVSFFDPDKYSVNSTSMDFKGLVPEVYIQALNKLEENDSIRYVSNTFEFQKQHLQINLNATSKETITATLLDHLTQKKYQIDTNTVTPYFLSVVDTVLYQKSKHAANRLPFREQDLLDLGQKVNDSLKLNIPFLLEVIHPPAKILNIQEYDQFQQVLLDSCGIAIKRSQQQLKVIDIHS